MKLLNLPKESQEVLLNGVSMFIVPISHPLEPAYMMTRQKMYKNTLIERFSLYQIGDEVYLQEEFRIGYWDTKTLQMAFDYKSGKCDTLRNIPKEDFFDCLKEIISNLSRIDVKPDQSGNYVWEKYNSPLDWNDASQMQPHQSRYKATIEDVKIVRIRELSLGQMLKTTGFTQYQFEENGWGIFIDWYNKQYENYEGNPYVFLYEVEEIK